MTNSSKRLSLEESYKSIRPSIVALVSRVSPNPDFPEILGTGYIVHEEGIILTCAHVIDVIKILPRIKGAPVDEWPILALMFKQCPEGMVTMPLEVVGVGKPSEWKRGFDYAPKLPDVGLVRVKVSNLPKVTHNTNPDSLIEGKKVAFSGFPMGTDTLRAPGWIQQFTPTLLSGNISAVMPFPCKNPHAFMIGCMTQGGASGSPVFLTNTGEVVGMVYAGLTEMYGFQGRDGFLRYKVPTNLTTAVPAWILIKCYESFMNSKQFKEHSYKKVDFNEMLKKAKVEVKKGKLVNPLKEIKASDLENRLVGMKKGLKK